MGSIEEHSIEMMKTGYFNSMAVAITAHGLGLMALFGTTVQGLSEANFGENASFLTSSATSVTFFITGCAYSYILAFANLHLPKTGGDEWDKNPDFGLTNASCYDKNPWMTDFEEKLLQTGVASVAVLFIVSFSVVFVQCFVHWRNTSKKVES